MKRMRAFTMVELLISMLILAIMGGVFVMAIHITYGGYMQTQDLVGGRQEIEYAFQSLSLQLSTASLGMPNSRNANLRGTFSNAFRGTTDSGNKNDPIMAFMGENNETWGGPVTIANFGYNLETDAAPTGNADFRAAMAKLPANPASPDIYSGTALYYAWAAPIYNTDRRLAVKLTTTDPGRIISNTTEAERTIIFNYDAGDADLIAGNLSAGDGLDMRSWAAFPTIGLPLLVTDINNNEITFQLAPGTEQTVMNMGTVVGSHVELYAVRACRLYVNSDRQLIQEIFGSNFRDSETSTINVLARNVAGSYFIFDKQRHMLTMYVAVRGEETGGNVAASGEHPQTWPAAAPAIKAEDRNHRITVQSMTWRIRN